MLRWYQSVLSRRPLFTQITTTALLFGAGDVLAQQAVEKKGYERHDLWRTGRMVFYGAGATLWYRALNRINYSSKPATVITRVLADQVVFTPINLTLFLSTMAFLEAYPASNPHAQEARTMPAEDRIKHRMHTTFYEALTKNWMIWPWVQLANFSVVPLNHRVLVVNVVALGWNCYLSYLNSKGSDGDEEIKKQ